MFLNYRKAIAVGGTAAAIIGIGGTALAVSGTPTTAGTATASSAPAHGKAHGHGLFRHLSHGQFVTKDKRGTITRTIYRGSVTAVSPTSITVQASDNATQTYAVTKDTKIRQRVKGAKPTASTIDKVAKGDKVVVIGVGTGTVTARSIVEAAK